jgi:hypothetical protein
MSIPDECGQCPNNAANAPEQPVKVPYGVRVGVAIAAGLFLATQCYSVQYGRDVDDLNPETVEIGHVGSWTIKTKEPNYLLAAGCGAIAMTALGIRFDNLVKFLPMNR